MIARVLSNSCIYSLESGSAGGRSGLLCGGGGLVLVRPVEGLLPGLHGSGELCGLRSAVDGQMWVHR